MKYENISEGEKKKQEYGENPIKVSQKMKHKCWLNIEKGIAKCGKVSLKGRSIKFRFPAIKVKMALSWDRLGLTFYL